MLDNQGSEDLKARKAEIARENGRKSKGPKTKEGKDRSSRNGIRHGLSANQNTLLTCESAEEYNEVLQAFIDDLRPATKAELRITQRIANIDWRMERLVMMETCLTNIDAATHCDEIISRFGSIDAIGVIIETWKETCKGTANAVELLRRYQGSLNHQMDSAHKMFDRFQQRRLDRKHQGLDLDDENYQVPEFDTLRDPQPTEVGEDIHEGDLYIEEPPKSTQAWPPTLVKQGEPTPIRQNEVEISPGKRPAA